MIVAPTTILPAPSDSKLLWFESSYRVVLPESVKALFKKYNGAVPITNLFNQGKRERLIERFLCILDNPSDDLDHGCYDVSVIMSRVDSRLVDDENQVGMKIIPVASLFAGDLVCLDFRTEPGSPKVVVWDHELSQELLPHVEVIAPSFTLFIDMLKQ